MRNRHRIWLSAKLSIAFAGALYVSSAHSQITFSDTQLSYKAHNSVVRIDVVFKRGNRPVGSAWGHGVFVSPSGIILTAAHVAFPSKGTFESYRATDYELRIERYDLSSGAYEPVTTLAGKDVYEKARISGHQQANLSNCHNYFIGSRCRSQSLDEANDFALVPLGSHAEYFVGLAGPEDAIGISVETFDMGLAVASDFNRVKRIDVAEVSAQIPTDWPTLFKTHTTAEFGGGVSGSPLYLYKDWGDTKIFTAGVVISQLVRTDVLGEGTPLANEFSAFTVHAASDKRLSSAFSILAVESSALGRGKNWNCKKATFPQPYPLYTYYLAARTDKGSRKVIKRCGMRTLGWLFTSAALEISLQPETREIVSQASNVFRFDCDEADSRIKCQQRATISAAAANNFAQEIMAISAEEGALPASVLREISKGDSDAAIRASADNLAVLASQGAMVETRELNSGLVVLQSELLKATPSGDALVYHRADLRRPLTGPFEASVEKSVEEEGRL